MADNLPDPSQGLAESPAPRRAGIGRFVALLILIALVAAECIVASFLLPSGTITAEQIEEAIKEKAEAPYEEDLGDDDGKSEEEIPPETEETEEVDLGHFTITMYQPTSNTTLRIDFNLNGTILKEDKPEFDEAMQTRQFRFRDQVITTVRSADVRELSDPNLSILKRKILQKGNNVLGRHYLHNIFISSFTFIES